MARRRRQAIVTAIVTRTAEDDMEREAVAGVL